MAFAVLGTVAAVSAGIAAVGGIVKAVDGGIKAKRAKEDKRKRAAITFDG